MRHYVTGPFFLVTAAIFTVILLQNKRRSLQFISSSPLLSNSNDPMLYSISIVFISYKFSLAHTIQDQKSIGCSGMLPFPSLTFLYRMLLWCNDSRCHECKSITWMHEVTWSYICIQLIIPSVKLSFFTDGIIPSKNPSPDYQSHY